MDSMPQTRNFYYRTIKCPLCQKVIKTTDNQWFCSKKCEEEWKKLNGELKKGERKHIKGQDTSG